MDQMWGLRTVELTAAWMVASRAVLMVSTRAGTLVASMELLMAALTD